MKRTVRGVRLAAGLALVVTLALSGCATAATTPPRATTTRTASPSDLPSATRLHGTITQTLRLSEAPADCPIDAAWSPSGAWVAVLATRDTCLARPAIKPPDLIIIFDAHSGAIVRQLSLASALTQAKADIMREPRFGFSGLSWSPDGSKIVVPFQYTAPTPSPQGFMGILIVSVQGGAVRALAGPSNFGPSPTGDYPRFTDATVWNVQSGAPAARVNVPLTAAESYQWSADGHITTAQPSAHAPTPAATLANSGQFSYWQPGFVAAVPTSSNAAHPVWMFYTAAFTRWSSNGRYVVAGLMTLNKAGTSTDSPTSIAPDNCRAAFLPQPCSDQPVPAPDAAFRTVLAAVRRAADGGLYPNEAPVAWRPDGAALATVLPGDDATGAHRAMTITLLATASGQVMGTVDIPIQASQGNTGWADWPYFAWSPTSNQLAVVNDIDNTVEVGAFS